MEELQITAVKGMNGARILRLRGVLTLRTISEFQTIARQEGDSPLIIDLSGVTYVDSAGLGAVLGLFVSAQRKKTGFAVAGASADRVRILFQVTHLADFVPSYATVTEAEASLVKAAGA
jgi:anti-sigma B factor antagonist